MRSGAGPLFCHWRDCRTVAPKSYPYRWPRGTIVTPFITDRPSAHRPASGSNSHIPYGLYICSDGSQVLHDRNYVPTHWRPGDGFMAAPVSLLRGDVGRWCSYQEHGYFYVRGNHPIGMRSKAKTVRAEIARGEAILRAFCEGVPVWHYLVKADAGVPTGWFRSATSKPSRSRAIAGL